MSFPYQDPTLSPEQRTEDLLSRMETADKVGLMFQTMVTYGELDTSGEFLIGPPLRSMVEERRMSHFNIVGVGESPSDFVAWQNSAQRIALAGPLGIPITFSTDPRHAFTDNPATSMLAGPFSQWPETLGLAAVRSPELVRRFGDIVRKEYLAVGIRLALHPQIDLATEPRWARVNGTFGEDAELTSQLVAEYIRGMQGEELGPESVSTMTKHFPGGGPQKDGEDPHFPYGREQVYPGGRFDYHLKPFRAAIAAGAAQMMPYYGMPIGTKYEEVAFGFNRGIVTGLLRDELGFTGIVCTDWGILTDAGLGDSIMSARSWGVEHLTRPEKLLKAINAGVDQLGGEHCTDVLLDLVADDQVSVDRLDASARRLLLEKFRLGLFDNPFADEAHAEAVVGNTEHREAGLEAQSRSVTVLTNDNGANGTATLPLPRGIRVYAEGIDDAVLADFAEPVASAAEADIAILRVEAPYDHREGALEAYFHAGSLAFKQEQIDHISAIAGQVPTVLDVYLDRAAILTPLIDHVAATVVNFGVSDIAFLRALFGDCPPEGKLPFDMPRSMEAVEASDSDAPFSTEHPLFSFGHGLTI
ncbi:MULTISPECIES: glycoside hydrolase family 3 protein [unclassified Curtobacterium]|uniref:glycoside hydrolase family 3 protein n=1 Tax=unclassified Curtobacterium TaxID=257496 RepID=UPI003A802649